MAAVVFVVCVGTGVRRRGGGLDIHTYMHATCMHRKGVSVPRVANEPITPESRPPSTNKQGVPAQQFIRVSRVVMAEIGLARSASPQQSPQWIRHSTRYGWLERLSITPARGLGS